MHRDRRRGFGIPLGKLGVTTGFTEADTVARLIGPAALKYLLLRRRTDRH
ncbi:hypothetical protein ABLN85_01305 [Mycobacterium tuberculosis]